MDDAIKNAQARIEGLAEAISTDIDEIKRLQAAVTQGEAEMNRLMTFIDTWYELTGMQRPPTEERNVAAANSSQPVRRPKNPDRLIVVEHCLGFIHVANRPLSRRELFDRLLSTGIEINGKEPEMVLSTMLWRSKDQIVRLPEFGYWPADRDYPPAGYFQHDGIDLMGEVAGEPEGGAEAEDAEY